MFEHYIELEKRYNLLKQENEDLKNEINDLIDLRVRKRKFHFSENISTEQQRLNRVNIKDFFFKFNRYINSIGLEFREIDIFEIVEEGEIFKINFLNKTNQKSVNTLEKFVFWKDYLYLSDKCYAMLKTEWNLKIPSLYQIRKCQKLLDNDFEILNIKNGCYVDFLKKSELILSNIISLNKELDKFKIKYCGDGTNVGKNLKLFNFNFSVIDETNKCKTAAGHYTLGIFEIYNENYIELKDYLEKIFEDIDELNQIQINEKIYELDKYIGGDWKFLANFSGINSASSNYPCIYCTCHKKDFWDHTANWSIIDKSKGARSQEESNLLRFKTKIDDKKGYKNEPLSKVPFYKYIIDTLHLFLRISDILYNLFFIEIQTIEYLKLGYPKKSPDIEKTFLIKRLRNFLKEKCRIQNSIYIDKNQNIKLKDLKGPEKLRLFKRLNISELFPEFNRATETQKLWVDFFAVYLDLTRHKLCHNEIDIKCRKWLEDFIKLNHQSDVTPYIHVFAHHLSELTELHGDINLFNQQGHEKLNDMTTSQYFRSCNKKSSKKSSYLTQIMKKRNRIEKLSVLYNIQVKKSSK